MGDKPDRLGDRVKRFLYWTKIVSLVVFITLGVIFVLQNLGTDSTVAFLGMHAKAKTVVVIFFSFLAGVVATILALLIRRTPSK